VRLIGMNTGNSPQPRLTEAKHDQLRALGLKATVPRLRIIDLLLRHAERSQHVSAEEIHDELRSGGESISLATVYRVLLQLVERGVVESHQFAGERAVFELARKGEHDHMMDINDGAIVEFSDEIVRARLHELAAEKGYEIVDLELTLYVRGKSPPT
jgi:Fur family transcriptional regulator, ferric uptake regulator